MKTNVTMTRKMGQFDVLQRTKDGMFNANSLVEQWNKSGQGKKKEIKRFFENENTKEFIEALESEENLHRQNSAYVKSRASRGVNAGTWMHPYLFIKFAMWLNPKFEVKVIKFVYDELIKNRHLAGDNYNRLTSSIAKFKGVDYSSVAKGINCIIFNKHKKNIRNTANDENLRELHELEGKLSFAVNMGLISNYNQLMETMRKMWTDKYSNF